MNEQKDGSGGLFGHLANAWVRFRYDETPGSDASGTTESIQSVGTAPAAPINLALAGSPASSPAPQLTEAFKEALVNQVAESVPSLKEILELSALLLDEIEDPVKRIRVVIKQKKLTPENLGDLVRAIDGAILAANNQIAQEVAAEEHTQVALPRQELDSLQALREQKAQELEKLNDQIQAAAEALSGAERQVVSSQAKSKAGADFLIQWGNQLKALLPNFNQ